MKAQDVPFSWEEQILKWLDPTIGRFFGELTDQQRATLVTAVENIDEFRVKMNDPDLTPQELIHDLMEEWGHAPVRDHDEAIRKIVGTTRKSLKPPSFQNKYNDIYQDLKK